MATPTQAASPVQVPPPSQAELDAIERARAISARRKQGEAPPASEDTQGIDAAPGKMTLGGVAYLIAPPAAMDLGAVIAHVKRLIKTPMQELKEDEAFNLLPEEEQKQLMQDRARWYFKNRDKWVQMSLLEALLSPEGVAFAFWIFARKNQPTLALEEVRKHITETNAAVIFCQLDMESAMHSLGNLGGLSG